MNVGIFLPCKTLALSLPGRYTTLMQPEKIGIYEIKSELGRGGMATVYRGYDPRFEREVAVKILPPELLHADPQFRMRFQREAKIIAQLEHPSIVPVYDVGETEDGKLPYFVMKYMNGGSLSERIKKGIMSVADAARILEQIAPGLDEAHSRGFIHRDLKPSNILFDSRGIPYISDFGIAKMTQSSGTMTGSGIIGTPAYMSPEQATGEQVDGRTDIYSLGIILFEMLTGKQPYEADTPMAVAIKHVTDPVPRILTFNPNLPADMDLIIQKAMAKSRDDRFGTAVEMVQTLKAIAGQLGAEKKTQTLSALRATRKHQVVAEKRKFSPAIIAVIVLGVIGVAAAGYWLTNRNSPPVEKEATQTSAPTSAPVTFTSMPTVESTVTSAPATETATLAAPRETLAPKIPLIGGADKIAFVANRDIWLMNVDGSDLRQLTFDGAAKTDLQWLNDGKTIIFISGKTIKYFDITTDTVDTLATFPAEVSVDAFQVSHDNKQVQVAMSNTIFVVPFDIEQFKAITNRGQLSQMKDACLVEHTPKTMAVARVREARWSSDDQLVAWLYTGNDANNPNLQAEQIGVLDISDCKPELIDLKDNFPGTRFTPAGYESHEIPDFDWDGMEQFTFNTNRRNNGWGEMYIYNWLTHKGIQQTPIGSCCYRDVRWSPNGTFILIAFQDQSLGPDAKTQLFYLPSGELDTGANLTPLPLPEGFFKDPREGIQAALRPAQQP